MVLGSFILFNAFLRKKQKKSETLHDEFENSILENSQSHVAQLKRVEQMQQDHKINTAFEKDRSNPFVIHEDPLLQDFNEPDLEEKHVPSPEIKAQAPVAQAPKKAKNNGFIALTVIPKHSAQFTGIALQATLSKHHFRYGAQKLYHRHYQDNPSQGILYSVASIANPGFFDQATITQQSFPGLLVYMLLDEVEDPVLSFEKMLTCARQLSASLQAEVCDAKRQPITTTTIQNLRDQAKAATQETEMREEEYQEW